MPRLSELWVMKMLVRQILILWLSTVLLLKMPFLVVRCAVHIADLCYLDVIHTGLFLDTRYNYLPNCLRLLNLSVDLDTILLILENGT